jgi:membrane protein required for colicin V production
MTTFDIILSIAALIALISGFRAGLVRSLATILGYIIAGPIALAATSFVTPAFAGELGMPWGRNSLVFFAIFLMFGMFFGHLLKLAASDTFGADIHIADRCAGASLGALRVFLVGVTLVLVLERIIPPAQQPAFLTASALRPSLSYVGQSGLRSLPPEIADYIDRLKQQKHL